MRCYDLDQMLQHRVLHVKQCLQLVVTNESNSDFL